MGLEGDFAELGRLAAELEGLGDRLPEVAAQAAKNLDDVLLAQFDNGHDPDGEPWTQLSASTLRRHGPPPLTDTRDMRDSARAEADGTDIALTVASPAEFHQFGSGRMHRRILPDEDAEVLPPAYELAVTNAADEIRQALERLAA